MRSTLSTIIGCMAASLILAACGNAARTPSLSPSPIPLLPSGTSIPLPTSSPKPTPTTFPTSTNPYPACDPAVADYCVVNAFFVFQLPIAPPGTDRIDRSYPYGSMEGGKRDPHHGVEFYNGSGTPVTAAADGEVYFAGDDRSQLFSPWSNFYGNLIIIKHEFQDAAYGILYTLYAHLSKLEVTTGQTVTGGQKIGEVGASGSAQGSHLHFEVRVKPDDYNSTLNPELWLVPHSGNGTLSLLATDKTGKIISPAFNIQYFPDRNQPAAAAYQVGGYAPETINASDPWGEIAALGDQSAGWYRITFFWESTFYERWVEIQTGKLTRVMIMVK